MLGQTSTRLTPLLKRSEIFAKIYERIKSQLTSKSSTMEKGEEGKIITWDKNNPSKNLEIGVREKLS